MKKTIVLLFVLTGITFGLNAQNSLNYSLTRPFGGGNLQLVEFDLGAGSETVIKTYNPSELDDYNPGATSFDHQNNRFITLGNISGNDSIISINVTNGNIISKYASPYVQLYSLENNGAKTYSLTRPIGGGNLQLVEFDLGAGSETVIKTYNPSELDDYNPEATSFDHQNNRFITLGNISGNDSIISIDVTNGNIIYKYTSPSVQIYSLENNGDLSNDVNVIKILSNNFMIFPNPSKEQFHIQSRIKFEKLEIMNSSGSLVKVIKNQNSSVNISDLPSGTYLVKIYTDKGSSIQKLIKE